jgi:ribosome-associated protein
MNYYQNIDIESLLKELEFKTTRSSGKGGQNVNKVSTKVILIFDIVHSQSINNDLKVLLSSCLQNKISKNGLLQMSSSKERSQYMNKKAVVAKFLDTIEKALITDEERIATKPKRGAKENRLKNKSMLSEKKLLRRKNSHELE